MRKIILLLFLQIPGLFTLLNAQVTPEIQKGDQFIEEFEYGKAIYFYNLAHEYDDQNPVATRRLADVYNRIGDYQTSCDWYMKTLELDGATDQDMLLYAEALKRLERYDEAIFWYNKFATVNPDDRRAQEHIRNQQYFQDLWSDSLKYRLHQMEINSERSIFGVAPFGEKYLFSSNMINESNSLDGKSHKNAYLDIYICDESGEEFIDAFALEGDVNSKYHDGPVYFDENSKTLYITRNNIKKGKPVKDQTGTVNLQIYTSVWDENEGWQEVQELSFNSDEYSTGHPCLSKDGMVLFFVSNMPGGYGGTDIYKSFWMGDHWGEPINLGENVNTEGNEMFPYVSKEGIIYFASDGHAGLGGLDNFMCEPWGEKWSVAYNLGYPINTSKDDFSLLFVPGSEIGFFSSNRGGNGNDKVFFFKQLDILEQLVVGRISIDNDDISLAGEKILVKYINRNQELTFPLKENGEFDFVIYPGDDIEIYMNNEYYDQDVVASYQAEDKLVDTRVELGEYKTFVAVEEALAGVVGLGDIISELAKEDDIRNALLRLKGELTELDADLIQADEIVMIDDTEMLVLKAEVKDLNIDNVYFAFDSYVINRDAKTILDDIVFHMRENPYWKIEIDTHTDSRGSAEYNQFLSEQRANAVRKYLLKNGIDAERILSRAHGEKKLAKTGSGSKDEEDMHSANRRAEFRYMIETSSSTSEN